MCLIASTTARSSDEVGRLGTEAMKAKNRFWDASKKRGGAEEEGKEETETGERYAQSPRDRCGDGTLGIAPFSEQAQRLGLRRRITANAKL